MPYCRTSYDTTAGQVQKLDPLALAIKQALVTGMLQERRLGVLKSDQKSAVFVIGGNTDELHIPAFTHPYLIQNFKGQDYLVSDVRRFRNISREWISEAEFEKNVSNKVEYGLTKSRAVLGLAWLDMSKVPTIRSRFSFAGTVFASWVTQAISRFYALDFGDQALIQATAIYYYHTLFSLETKLEGSELELAVIHATKATNLSATTIMKLFESFGDVRSADDFCELVKTSTDNSVRLKDFNRGILMTLIGNTWYGTNAVEMLAVALEHPPTWIAIVYATLTERSYKNSQLFKIVEFNSKRGAGDQFTMNYVSMFRDQVMALETASNELVIKDFED